MNEASNIAFIIIACIQLLFTSGVFIWLIKKIVSMSERLTRIEAIFEYVKADHDDIIEAKTHQKDMGKDLNECFKRLRALETAKTQH